MHHSPSLFFDILTTEDEQKREEKIRRASFDIKSAQTSSPPNSKKMPQTAQLAAAGAVAVAAAEANGNGCVPSALTPLEEAMSQQPQEQQAAQPSPDTITPHGAAEASDLVLTPQEVLQELLGDMYIHTSRLTMGDLLGQGGFADVHAAELSDPLMPAFTEPVAVKRLRPDVLKSPDDLREFLTEANLLRKLQHRNIVRLRGVGATDLTDLVSMRESMFVVQEFMAGGDLKQMVMSAMSSPFDPPYTKAQAFAWAMHIAEAMHYLHSVCCPMIIHRDLKLDNVLLTGGNMHERVAKLADFGLHKRVRKMTSSGALVTWNQETTYHGGDFDRSFYGGKLYLVKSAMSIASSVAGDDSAHGSSFHGNSLHGGTGTGSVHGGSCHAGSQHATWANRAFADGAPVAAAATANGHNLMSPFAGQPSAAAATGSQAVSGSKPPLLHKAAMANGAGPDGVAAAGGAGVKGVQCSDSAGSLPANDKADVGKQQQQLLQGAVRAKSQGLLGKQEFVTRVLSVPSSSKSLQQGPILPDTDKEVVRTFAAVQALEGSVRAGSAFYQQPSQQQQTAAHAMQQQQQPQVQQQQQQVQQQQQQQRRPLGSSSSNSRRFGRLSRQQSELCPQLLQQLQSGQHSAKFIEATQKVGSLMYMAPEVLTGHQYNEKIDVFSFGIILYELLSGVVVASRVALQGEYDELLDYARQVANGHRESIPSYWPAPVRDLISRCWAQDPRQRPGFKQVLKELYAMKQSGVDAQMEGLRPKGDYNPLTDCGCSIM